MTDPISPLSYVTLGRVGHVIARGKLGFEGFHRKERSLGFFTTSRTIDSRLAFLARAHARFILVEAGQMSLEEALVGLVEPICECQRWPLASQWERTHPPLKYRRWRRTGLGRPQSAPAASPSKSAACGLVHW
jgi:hypothetical protein